MTTWLIATLCSAVWFLARDEGVFALVGSLACLVLSLPLLIDREYDLLSPWTLLLFAAYIGYGIRGVFIAAGINGTRDLEQLYLLGRPPTYFIWPSFVFLLGVVSVTVGFLAWRIVPRGQARGLLARSALRPGMVVIVINILAAIGFISFLLYAQRTGGFSLSSLSAKRATITGINLNTSTYESHGTLRRLASLSGVAFWLAQARFSHGGFKYRVAEARTWLIVCYFVNACLLPVYSSTRIDIVFLVVGALVIELCHSRRRLRSRTLVLTAAIVVMGVATLTGLRNLNQGATRTVEVTTQTVIDTFVLTRTFSDVPTTSHIIRGVPAKLAFANGDTVTSWLVAPIPRDVWPDKPIVSLGPTIGFLLYGNPRSGVPPGMIAEGYWNFGLVGVLSFSLLSGVVIGAVERWSQQLAKAGPLGALILAGVGMRFGFDIMSNSVGFAIYQFGVNLLPALLLAPLIGTPSTAVERAPHDARRSPFMSHRRLR